MHTSFHRRRAVALVIVLAMLAILSTLLIAFMGRVTTENVAATSISHSIEAKQAYDSAVNLAMSQIREGTRTDGTRAWASQPGAIRTFDSTGKDTTVYKLYSSDVMKVEPNRFTPSDPVESGIDLTDLNKTPPGFVNLNEPILIPIPGDAKNRVEPRYPIVNPSARRTTAGGEPVPDSPVRALRAAVDGFYTPKIAHPSNQLDGTNQPVLALPMRVKWLYQLKDGTMVALDATQKIPGASKLNPPVARVAFWTDDESAKVNVNTASENTYWDSPMASCAQESGRVNTSTGALLYDPTLLALGASQPARREYQRFPGHPATTCLSPVLRWMAPTMSDPDFKEAIYRLAPRIAGGAGSSMGGSATTDTNFVNDNRIYDRDRLFATLDEYWFRPDRSQIGGNGIYPVFRETGGNQFDPLFTSFTPEALDRVRFFLTANSRAPELNLWGMPRVCIWPVAEKDALTLSTSKRSSYDDLITFCSTVATKPYIFGRKDPWSTSYDFETCGADTRGIDPVTGVDRIYTNPGRNKQLVDNYLRMLTKKPIPGIGKSFNDKYGLATSVSPTSGGFTEMDQILLEIFDYIRSTNLIDTGRPEAGGNYPLAYTPGYGNYTGSTKPNLGSGQVIPTVRRQNLGGIKGFGRFTNLAELGIMFYYDNTSLDGESTLTATDTAAANPIRCVLLPEMYTVSPGYPALSEGYAIRIQEVGPAPMSVTVSAVQFNLHIAGSTTTPLATPLTNYVEVDPNRVPYGRFFMPTRGFASMFYHDNGIGTGGSGGRVAKTFSKQTGGSNKDLYSRYPYYSKRFLVPKTASTFHFSGGTFKIELLSLAVPDAQHPPVDPLATDVIQEMTVTFAGGDFPVPTQNTPFQSRLASISGDGQSLITANDVIRTMEPCGTAKGDYRLLAGNVVASAAMWGTSGTMADYLSTSKQRVDNFHVSHGDMMAAAGVSFTGPNGGANVYATLSNGATPRGDKRPKVAVAAQGSYSWSDNSVTGDFDRHLSKFMDGPFINKPDEGNVRFSLADDPGGGGGIPYYRGGNGYEEVGESFFSPNRMIPSAVMFGSLPSGLLRNHQFETLLFAPAVSPSHPGAAISPPDHYLLDLFQMPVVEPYAISEPLSCSGRINLNCRIAPFGYVKVANRSYIERTTGLYAILTGMKQLSIPTGAVESGHHEKPLERSDIFRFDLDVVNIVNKAISPYLDNKGYFRSPSQICELDLFTLNGSTSEFSPTMNRRTYWESHNVTGDNARERPYAHIYPRLTTKSNVYTVHAWSQAITKNPATKDDSWNVFDESTDRITGEYRGSTTIERFIDPNDPAMAGYDAATPNATDLERYYRFRIVNSKRFPGE